MDEAAADSTSLKKVTTVGRLEHGEPFVTEVAGEQIVIFKTDNGYFALNNTCPHQGGPLGQGRVDENCVFCPWHGWEFDIESGEHIHGDDSVQTYEVVVEGEEVFLSI